MWRGTAYETSPQGRRPLAGVELLVFVENSGTGNATTTTSNSEGRYEFPANLLEDGATARVYAMGGAGFYRHQPCVATTRIQGATVLDVEYNPRHVTGTGGSPTVSGRIFQPTSAGRQAVPDLQVLYYVGNQLAANTWTSEDGRYEFCSVPTGAGKVFVPDFSDWDYWGPLVEQSVNVAGDLVVDLEIR